MSRLTMDIYIYIHVAYMQTYVQSRMHVCMYAGRQGGREGGGQSASRSIMSACVRACVRVCRCTAPYVYMYSLLAIISQQYGSSNSNMLLQHDWMDAVCSLKRE
eukprot:GHVU01225960.1.p2 GENE.GHVU01225960.1~~GHVU01225960.1.p2  ORF type:complete len:104 (-),score=16.13 GHVU01225960.1:358-669(-)